MSDDLHAQNVARDTIEEQARWFLLSVWRNHNSAIWDSSSESGLSEQDQYKLVKKFLGNPQAAQSLKVVLRDERCRFKLVSFAAQRRTESLILSDTTLAYRIAREILQDFDQAKSEVGAVSEPRRDPLQEAPPKTVVSRRAARRQIAESGHARITAPTQRKKEKRQASQLSETEYTQLEQAISHPVQSNGKKRRVSKRVEEWLSRLAGLIVGSLLFLLISLLFF